MTIRGKVFPIRYVDSYPSLNVRIEVSTPDPKSSISHKFDNVLIDTGSDFTFIPNGVIKTLKLKWTGTEREICGFDDNMYSLIKFYPVKLE